MGIDTRNLKGLTGEFRPKVEAILRDLFRNGWNSYVCSGKRTFAEQQEKVAKGYSPTLYSQHLAGKAADIVPRATGYAFRTETDARKFWLLLGRLALMHGLHWGGLFRPYSQNKIVWTARRARLRKALLSPKWQDYTGAIGRDPSHVEMS
jgi:hypothetical protein